MKSIFTALAFVVFFSTSAHSALDPVLGEYIEYPGDPNKKATDLLGTSTDYKSNANAIKEYIKNLSKKESEARVRTLSDGGWILSRTTSILSSYFYSSKRGAFRLYSSPESQRVYVWKTIKDLNSKKQLTELLNYVDSLKKEYARIQGESIKKPDLKAANTKPELNAKTFFGENPDFRDQVYKDAIAVLDNLKAQTDKGTDARGFLTANGRTDLIIERFSVLMDYLLYKYENGARLKQFEDSTQKINYLESLIKKYPDESKKLIEEMYSGKPSPPQAIAHNRSLVKSKPSSSDAGKDQRWQFAQEPDPRMTASEKTAYVERLLNGFAKHGSVYSMNSAAFAVALTLININKFMTEYPSNPRVFDSLREMLINPATYAQLAPFHYMQMKYDAKFGEMGKAASSMRSTLGLNMFDAVGMSDLARRSGKLLWASAKISGLFMVPVAISQMIGRFSNTAYACYQIQYNKERISTIEYKRFGSICADGYFNQWLKSETAQQFVVDMHNTFWTGMIFFTGAQVYDDLKNSEVGKNLKSRFKNRIRILKGGTSLPATAKDVEMIHQTLKDAKLGKTLLIQTTKTAGGGTALKFILKFGRISGSMAVFFTLYDVVDSKIGIGTATAQTISARILDHDYGKLTRTLSACLPYYGLTTKYSLPPDCQGTEILSQLEEFRADQEMWHNKITKKTREAFTNWVIYYNELLNRYAVAKNFYRDLVWQIQKARQSNIKLPVIEKSNKMFSQFYDLFDWSQKSLNNYETLPFLKTDTYFRLTPGITNFPLIDKIQKLSRTNQNQVDSYKNVNSYYLKDAEFVQKSLTETQILSMKMQPRVVGLVSQVLENEVQIRKNLDSQTVQKLNKYIIAFRSKKQSDIVKALFDLNYEASLNRERCEETVREENPLRVALENSMFSVMANYQIAAPFDKANMDVWLDKQLKLEPLCRESEYFSCTQSNLGPDNRCIFEEVRQALYGNGYDERSKLFSAGAPVGPGGAFAEDYEVYLRINGVDASTRDQHFHGRDTKSMIEYLLLSMACGPDNDWFNDKNDNLLPDKTIYDDRGWKGRMDLPRITKGASTPEICQRKVPNSFQQLIHNYRMDAPMSYIYRENNPFPFRVEIDTLSLYYPFESDGKTYASIMDYIYQNFDGSFLGKQSFDTWWRQTMERRYVALLNAAYDEFKTEILEKEYYPLLHDKAIHNEKFYAILLGNVMGDLKLKIPLGILPAIREEVTFYFNAILEPLYNSLYQLNPVLNKEHFLQAKKDLLDQLNVLFLVAHKADSEDLKLEREKLVGAIRNLYYLFGIGVSENPERQEENPYFLKYDESLIHSTVGDESLIHAIVDYVANDKKKNLVVEKKDIISRAIIKKTLQNIEKAALSAAEAEEMANMFLRERRN